MKKLVLALSILLILPTTARAGGRYYVHTVWSLMDEAKDPALTRELVDVMKRHGFNGLSTDIHWNTIREDGSYDFSQLDRVVEAALAKRLAVFIRVNTTLALASKPYWVRDEHLACSISGEPFIREPEKIGIPSITNREVLRRMAHFYEAVGRHCREKFGSGKVVCFTAAFTPYVESEYWKQIDYSPAAKTGFVSWAKKEYGSIPALNRKWGTEYKSWSEIDLVKAHPTAQELYFEHCLRRFFCIMSNALKKGDPKAKFGMQTGCIWDHAQSRRTANCARFFDVCDWLFVADAPTYPHRFTCDYLRGVSQGRVNVSNEIDNPYLQMVTNERILNQGIETWEQGVNTLFLCNWYLNDLKNPKFTALDELGKLARRPAAVVEADRAMYISVWDLVLGRGAVHVYQDFYNKLPDKDKRPVDIINDGVFDRDPAVLKKYKEVYLPLNERIPEASRKALLAVKERLLIQNPSLAGTLDEYNRSTKPLAD